MVPRETENNAYAKFGVTKKRALWYVMVFSGVVRRRTFLVLNSIYWVRLIKRSASEPDLRAKKRVKKWPIGHLH